MNTITTASQGNVRGPVQTTVTNRVLTTALLMVTVLTAALMASPAVAADEPVALETAAPTTVAATDLLQSGLLHNGLLVGAVLFSLGLRLWQACSSGPVLRGPTGGRSVLASIFDLQPPATPHVFEEMVQ